MKFTKESAPGVNRIDGWRGRALRINGRETEGTVVVSADTIQPVTLAEPAGLDAASLEPALGLDPEVVLLGTGDAQRWPPARLVADLAKRGVGLEVMDTLAAARTFNVLVGEERRVVAVLYPPGA